MKNRKNSSLQTLDQTRGLTLTAKKDTVWGGNVFDIQIGVVWIIAGSDEQFLLNFFLRNPHIPFSRGSL